MTDRTVDLVEEDFDVSIFAALQKFNVIMAALQLGIAEVLLCASPEYVIQHGAPLLPEDMQQHACLIFIRELLSSLDFSVTR